MESRLRRAAAFAAWVGRSLGASLAVVQLLCSAAVLAGGEGVADEPDGLAWRQQPFSEAALRAGSAIPEPACRRLTHAVWVTHAQGRACVRYYPSPDLGQGPGRTAVVFFHGDRLDGMAALGGYGRLTPQDLLDTARRQAESYGVPFVLVARPGVFGSSGDHKQRHQLAEFLSLDAAVRAIRTRHGLARVALAGQSGGATAVAALLALGRTDVACAALGSGAYDAVDAIGGVGGIAVDPARPIQLVADPEDAIVPFAGQRAFHQALRHAGHVASLFEARGDGPDRHRLSHVAWGLAAACAREAQGLSLPISE